MAKFGVEKLSLGVAIRSFGVEVAKFGAEAGAAACEIVTVRDTGVARGIEIQAVQGAKAFDDSQYARGRPSLARRTWVRRRKPTEKTATRDLTGAFGLVSIPSRFSS